MDAVDGSSPDLWDVVPVFGLCCRIAEVVHIDLEELGWGDCAGLPWYVLDLHFRLKRVQRKLGIGVHQVLSEIPGGFRDRTE